jgi:hypothetical protein
VRGLRPSAELTTREMDQDRHVRISSVAIADEMGVSEGLFLSFLVQGMPRNIDPKAKMERR